MKLVFKILSASLVAGAFLLAGCAAESKSLPSIDTASTAELNAAGASLQAMSDGADVADAGSTVTGISYTGSTGNYTITFTNYDNGEGDIINGEVTIVASLSGSTATGTEVGSFVITGTDAGTVSFNLNVTSNIETFAASIKGTMTVNGTKYSYKFSTSGGASKADAVTRLVR